MIQQNSANDDFLEKILKNPFLYIFSFKEKIPPNLDPKTNFLEEGDISEILYSEEKKIINLFLRPIEIILRPHISVSQELLNRISMMNRDPTTKNIIEKYGSDFVEKLEMIRRFYRIFIEACQTSYLEKEADKLVKRFFGDHFTENHKNFIKLKRYFEKLKSFHENSSTLWKDILNLLETFIYIRETKSIMETVKERYIPNLLTLIRQTDTFLQLLQKYLKINQIHFEPANKSYTIHLTYDDTIDYTLQGFYESFLQPTRKNRDTKIEKVEITSLNNIESNKTKETLSLYLGTSKSNNNKISTYDMGSKDWNHSKEYFLELDNEEYQRDIEKFKESFYVVLSKKNFEESLEIHSTNQKKITNEQFLEFLDQYVLLLEAFCSEIYNNIVENDFKGILKPPIFFYHIGAKTIYTILTEELKNKNLGEILYIKNNLIFREYPYGIIKKIFINWFNDLVMVLDREEIDSYSIYSQQKEFILSEYLKDYERISDYFKKNLRHLNLKEMDRWFIKNYKMVLSISKFYVYKRFFPEILFDLKQTENLKI
ncbi:MAG: hypothetical protein ACK4UJ_01495 [Leptonema sp. (in: bacteria)]